WTMVNRNEYDITGEQLRVSHRAGMHYYDLWHGIELKPSVRGSEATISFNVEGLGFGAILATESPLSDAYKNLLAYMAERSKRPLSSYSRDWKFLPQAIVGIPATNLAQTPPPSMVRIPEGEYDFQVRGTEIEGGNDPAVDVQYPGRSNDGRFCSWRNEWRSEAVRRADRGRSMRPRTNVDALPQGSKSIWSTRC